MLLVFLGVIGSLVGRMPCAWVCPFGFMQELIHTIPSPKIEISRAFCMVKYAILIVFVMLLPLFIVDMFGYGENGFCAYVCPAGTLQAGIPMGILQPQLRELWGGLFLVKVAILLALLLSTVFVRRPFCRVLCPLGAIYSLFNRISLFRMHYHPHRCVRCGECYRNCPMGVRFYEGANQKDCIRCLSCMRKSCRYGAISHSLAGRPGVETAEETKATPSPG